MRQLRLVITTEIGGPAVGVVDLFDFDPLHQRAGVGITILASERRHGYARQALELLKNHARDVLRLHQIYATVGADNAGEYEAVSSGGLPAGGHAAGWLRTAQRLGRCRGVAVPAVAVNVAMIIAVNSYIILIGVET